MHAAGHEVIEIKPPAITEALCIFVALTGGDGYERLLASLEGDPAEPHLFLIRLQAAMGPYLTHFLSWLSSAKDPVMHSIISATGVKPVSEVLEWQHRKALFSGAARKHFFRDLALDAIICPIQATSAIKLKTSWSQSLEFHTTSLTSYGIIADLAFLAAPTVFFNVV